MTTSASSIQPAGPHVGSAREPESGSRKTRALWLGVLVFSAFLLLPMFYRYSGPTQTQDADSGCRNNLRLLGLALDRNAASHKGLCPRRLAELIPDNLSRIPLCPAAGADTYSAGYFVSEDRRSFRLECAGHHHGKISPNIMGPASANSSDQ